MSFVAIAAWLAGVGLSLYNGNRKLPLIILLLGVAAWIGTAAAGVPAFGTAAMALLAAIIWIANKADMG